MREKKINFVANELIKINETSNKDAENGETSQLQKWSS